MFDHKWHSSLMLNNYFYLYQGPNVLEDIDLVEMGINNATHRDAILHAASTCPPVSQTGLYDYTDVIYVIIFT